MPKTSKPYTNHCLRAYTVSRLNAENVPERHIMAITGHKNAHCPVLDKLLPPNGGARTRNGSSSQLLDGEPAPSATATSVAPTSEFGRDLIDLFTDVPTDATDTAARPQSPSLVDLLLADPVCSSASTPTLSSVIPSTGTTTSTSASSAVSLPSHPAPALSPAGVVDADVDALIGSLSPAEDLLALEAPSAAGPVLRNAQLNFGSGNNFSGAVFN
eukprot:scpid70479/ scgid24103/ 